MNNNILAHIQEHLIKRIQSTTDVTELIQIWILWDNLSRPVQLTEPTFRRTAKTITVADLKKAQNFKGTNWEEADKWAKAFDLQEPIEDLLLQLTQ
ncbi:MAG: hypothetical protein RL329_4239 [Bacteroidota bacterium]|jgi:hypothetical protein